MFTFPDNYTPTAHDHAMRRFLQDHPEHEGACLFREIDGVLELCVETSAMRAFVAWALAQGMIPAEREERAFALFDLTRDLEG